MAVKNFREIPNNLAIGPLRAVRLNASGSAFEVFNTGTTEDTLTELTENVETLSSNLATLNSSIPERAQDAVAGILVDSDSIAWDYNNAGSSLSARVLMPTYTLRLDDQAPFTYIGEALPGVSDSDPGWRIKRIAETGPDVEILWADGNSDFDNVWDDRLSLIYS